MRRVERNIGEARESYGISSVEESQTSVGILTQPSERYQDGAPLIVVASRRKVVNSAQLLA